MLPLPYRAAQAGMGPVIDPIRLPKSSVLTWEERSEELREGTMPRTTSSRRGGFYVEAAAIWEPQGTKFRPYSITTLIFFYIGKFFGRLFGRRH